MTKRVSNSREGKHRGRMARQMPREDRSAMINILRRSHIAMSPSTAPASMQIAAKNLMGALLPKGGRRMAAKRGL